MSLDMIRGMVEDKQKAHGLSFDVAVQQVRETFVALAVLTSTVVDSVDGSLAADAEMGSV